MDVRKVTKEVKSFYLLQVDLGEDKPRQFVAGIKEYYTPDELLNHPSIFVGNLNRLRLWESQSEGMVKLVEIRVDYLLFVQRHRRKWFDFR